LDQELISLKPMADQLFLEVTAAKGENCRWTSSLVQMGQVTFFSATSAMVTTISKICLHFLHSNS